MLRTEYEKVRLQVMTLPQEEMLNGAALRRYRTAFEKLIEQREIVVDAIRAAERISEDDLAIRVNTP